MGDYETTQESSFLDTICLAQTFSFGVDKDGVLGLGQRGRCCWRGLAAFVGGHNSAAVTGADQVQQALQPLNRLRVGRSGGGVEG